MTNDEIKATCYKIAQSYLADSKVKRTAEEHLLLKSAVDLGVNFLQNLNDMATNSKR